MILKVLTGNINSEFMLSRIGLYVPARSFRHYQLLYIEFQRSNYACAEPIRRMCMDFNNLYNIIDIDVEIEIVRNRIISYLNDL